jgi:hypothetical protein
MILVRTCQWWHVATLCLCMSAGACAPLLKSCAMIVLYGRCKQCLSLQAQCVVEILCCPSKQGTSLQFFCSINAYILSRLVGNEIEKCIDRVSAIGQRLICMTECRCLVQLAMQQRKRMRIVQMLTATHFNQLQANPWLTS